MLLLPQTQIMPEVDVLTEPDDCISPTEPSTQGAMRKTYADLVANDHTMQLALNISVCYASYADTYLHIQLLQCHTCDMKRMAHYNGNSVVMFLNHNSPSCSVALTCSQRHQNESLNEQYLLPYKIENLNQCCQCKIITTC